MTFKDHFSGHALAYARYRPPYPPSLFEFLAGLVARRRVAWDAATGNGQVAAGLARFFERVVASDASRQQVAAAARGARIVYLVMPSERSALAAGAVDLVTVGQALHWFDVERFWTEVRRVAAPGARVAAWCYGLFDPGPDIEPLLRRFYAAVEPFWPPERRWIDEAYGTLPFPFERLPAPRFEMAVEWSLAELSGYLATWSAVRRHVARHGRDPVEEVAGTLGEAWGEGRRLVRWPIHLLVGRVGGESATRGAGEAAVAERAP